MSLAQTIWNGGFGDEYTIRNAATDEAINAREDMWRKILAKVDEPRSALEVGANVGTNLRALRRIIGHDLYAVEPNDYARDILRLEGFHAIDGVASKIAYPDSFVDMVFTSGVLIHIPPDQLLTAMKEIHRCSHKYIACIEYFSVEPETAPYRGNKEILFKRDFGAMWLDHFPKLMLRDYGFFWKRATGLDNLTWQLFEKL